MEILDQQDQPALKPAKKLDLSRLFDGFRPKKPEQMEPAVPAENLADTLQAPVAAPTVDESVSAPLPEREVPPVVEMPVVAAETAAVVEAPAESPTETRVVDEDENERPDWLMPDTPAVSAPLPDAKDQVIEGTAAAAPDAPVIDEHFFGQTEEEIEAEKARKRAEFAAQAVSTPEAPIKTTMEEDLTAKGFKQTPFPESDGSQAWVNRGGETVRQAKFEETGLESEFDEGLKVAGSLQEVSALMEKKLEELESSATEGSRVVEKLETEKDQLTRESAAVQKYASRRLPSSRSKDRFAQAERTNLIAARTRYWEIQARLTQINGDSETMGELALVKQNLTKEELTTEARRLRQIQQMRGELEKWDTLAEQPFLYERYRELAHQKAEAEKNFAPSVASVVNESAIEEMDSLEQMLPWRLLEMEGLMPERGHGPEVSLDTSEETFAYNRALNRFRELLGPATEAYRQKAMPPETESASAPTAESADDAQQTIIDLKARVAQLEAELAKKAPSPAETAESNEDEIIHQLPEQVRQRLAEVGKITPQDGQQERGLEDQIGKMIAEGVEGGEINRRMAEIIKRLPESEQEAARDSLQRQLMARSIEIFRDGSLAPDEKKRRINSLSDLAKGVAETGELVFPGLGGLFDFLMQNIVDSINAVK